MFIVLCGRDGTSLVDYQDTMELAKSPKMLFVHKIANISCWFLRKSCRVMMSWTTISLFFIDSTLKLLSQLLLISAHLHLSGSFYSANGFFLEGEDSLWMLALLDEPKPFFQQHYRENVDLWRRRCRPNMGGRKNLSSSSEMVGWACVVCVFVLFLFSLFYS